MAEHGGYRKPRNPAPVSGPGRLARRTDGGPGAQNVVRLPNAGYGEGQEFQQIQSGAPMAAGAPLAATPTAAAAPAASDAAPDLNALFGVGLADGERPVPLTAPTQRPDEAVTAGAPVGPGPGPSAAVMAPAAGRLSARLESLLGDDLTGEIADLYSMVRSQGL